jgi:MFS family permease
MGVFTMSSNEESVNKKPAAPEENRVERKWSFEDIAKLVALVTAGVGVWSSIFVVGYFFGIHESLFTLFSVNDQLSFAWEVASYALAVIAGTLFLALLVVLLGKSVLKSILRKSEPEDVKTAKRKFGQWGAATAAGVFTVLSLFFWFQTTEIMFFILSLFFAGGVLLVLFGLESKCFTPVGVIIAFGVS